MIDVKLTELFETIRYGHLIWLIYGGRVNLGFIQRVGVDLEFSLKNFIILYSLGRHITVKLHF